MTISIEDRLHIQDLLAHYCRGLDTQNRDEFLGTFWPDGVLISSLAGGEFAGAGQIGQWFDRVHSEPEFEPLLGGQHRPANTLFDKATADETLIWSQFELLTKNDGKPRISAYGEYHDIVTKRDDQWRLSRREIVISAITG